MTAISTAAGEPQVLVLPDAHALATEAAERVAGGLAAAIARRGRAHLVLTGGSSAAPLYTRLAEPHWRSVVDWTRVHLWWGDERLVPSDHPQSNTRLALGTLVKSQAHSNESGTGAQGTDVTAGVASGIDIPTENVHPFPVAHALRVGGAAAAHAAQEAADRYADEIRSLVPPDAAGVPIFDVVLLGVGPDGHILSVFPGSDALATRRSLVVAVPPPTTAEPHLPRLTLSPAVLGAARLVLVMATGSGKAAVLRDALAGGRRAAELPAVLARRSNAIWLLDREAAALL